MTMMVEKKGQSSREVFCKVSHCCQRGQEWLLLCSRTTEPTVIDAARPRMAHAEQDRFNDNNTLYKIEDLKTK